MQKLGNRNPIIFSLCTVSPCQPAASTGTHGGVCCFGSDIWVAVFACRSQLERSKAIRGNQMAV